LSSRGALQALINKPNITAKWVLVQQADKNYHFKTARTIAYEMAEVKTWPEILNRSKNFPISD
jgi:hypothetical protein